MKTIGNHIRKRRLDLRLLIREVAERVGVDKTTVQFWENNRAKPSLRLIPKIIEFLGYNPYETASKSLEEEIVAFRKRHGLSQKKLARLAGIGPTTIAAWEKGEHQPTKRFFDKLISLFASYPSSFYRFY